MIDSSAVRPMIALTSTLEVAVVRAVDRGSNTGLNLKTSSPPNLRTSNNDDQPEQRT
uniref:Uncharacterized protein n=1 Tax=Arundo donax TaxID=35708 RepID=A0A0A8ZBA3_ARUDO